MNMRRNAERWPQVLGAVLLTSAAIAAGAYYYFQQTNGKVPTSPGQPNPDFTTAPEGGVKVNLPTTPMTNAPAAAPASSQTDTATVPALPALAEAAPPDAPANP
ncbi:MAG: hypothetical protein MUF47_01560 [Porphyrobacter sp.]|jgi:hypothetical protein|nr:hypothetical protein [Porphyrobacter sp.]